ncbi:polyphosphate kinase 2 family protein [Marinomonas atlantica]|uniref:polyphosphate kinase 2 family protein n=1 Tax=Marinomonas atlantica TaxID=1806668 RepID=UPI00082AA031|nr:PPK2 family polyphosphate kinase [Marinomonas atlantica]
MHTPSPIVLSPAPSLDDIDLNDDRYALADKRSYKKQLKRAQKAMKEVQQAYFHQGKRAIIVFQGWDASGKGGAIRRVTEKLDPRGYRVHPIAAPSKEEQGRHYLYRFQTRLPKPGTLAIFDRSWYERVLTERVEGFATAEQWQRAYQEINEFERLLMDDGVRIIKLFMNISKDEQLARFEERLSNPMKQWKLTEEDLRNRDSWSHYAQATDDMFQHTSTDQAPWQLIPANKKWYARITALDTIVSALASGVDLTPPPIDEALVKLAKQKLSITVSN